jgi:hypothetical protein
MTERENKAYWDGAGYAAGKNLGRREPLIDWRVWYVLAGILASAAVVIVCRLLAR